MSRTILSILVLLIAAGIWSLNVSNAGPAVGSPSCSAQNCDVSCSVTAPQGGSVQCQDIATGVQCRAWNGLGQLVQNIVNECFCIVNPQDPLCTCNEPRECEDWPPIY